MGYSSFYLIVNFGTLCWLVFITPALWLAASFLSCLNHDVFYWMKQIVTKKLLFNDWIGLVHETYIFLGMCAALNLKYFTFNTYGNAINSLLALLNVCVVVIYPFLFITFYRRFPRLKAE